MNTDVFFAEWRARAPGQRRDIARAKALLDGLGLGESVPPVLAVVGSKGKGTCAVYASATLAAAGLDVVTVTSPGLRNQRDRIRVNGAAVSEDDLTDRAATIAAARARLPAPADGYLSPSGLFLVAGLLHARETGADALVLEAGMGGRGDEIGLLPPLVVALTSVFAEHIGVLGDTVEEIAWEKASVTASSTAAVLHPPLRTATAEVVRRAVRERTSATVEPEVVRPQGSGLPHALLPAGLAGVSAELGCAAAGRLLDALHRGRPASARLRRVLASVRLPARLSHHTVPGSGTELIIDSAIDRTGISAALAYARRHWSAVDHVLVCLPDHKDVGGAVTELGALPVTAVELPDAHLHFDHALPESWTRVDAEGLAAADLAAMGARVLVLGTVYFTGRVLDLVGADTERLFTASG